MRFFLEILALEKLKKYQVDLKILSPSTIYKFDYLLDNDFFAQIDGPEVRKGKVNVSLSVVQIASDFEFDFTIHGIIIVDCDRCLDEMELSVETTNRLIVAFGEAYAETSDERVIVSEDDGFINVAWYMYEFIALAIPIKHVHNPGECNSLMESKLRELSVDELDDDDESLEAEKDFEAIDPRWEALRYLKDITN